MKPNKRKSSIPKTKRRVPPRPGNGKCGLVNTHQLAENLGEHEKTIISLRKAGVIPYVVAGPRCYRYFLADVIEALRKRIVKPKAVAS